MSKNKKSKNKKSNKINVQNSIVENNELKEENISGDNTNSQPIPALQKGEVEADKNQKNQSKDNSKKNKTKKTNDKKKDKKDKVKLRTKAKETFSELKKVSWPTFGEVCKKTGVVLVVVLVFAVVIFGIDYCLGLLVNLIK